MPIRLGLLLTAAVAALLFQNCAKAPLTAADIEAGGGSRKVTEGPLLGAKTFYLAQDPSFLMDDETVYRRGLRLDVATGVIINQDQQDSADGRLLAGQRFCLTPAERDELQVLVRQDSVCAGLNPMAVGQYCAMAIQLPYAIYGSPTQAMTAVGGANCLKAPDVDFCGGQGERVADLLDQVMQTLDQRVCGP